MNGIEKITAHIQKDAQEEIAQINQKAQSEAAAIRDSYGKMAEEEYLAALKRGEHAAQQQLSRLTGVARLESKKQLLATRQQMVDQAFDLALVKLATLPESETVEFLSALAAQASRTGQEQLLFSPEDREKYGEKVVSAANQHLRKAGRPAAVTLSSDTLTIRGGFIMKDDRIEVNCTYETLVRLHRDSLASEVAQILF